MEIEDRESTDSGSLSGNPDSESPPLSGGGHYTGGGGGGVVPVVINMNVSMDSSGAGVGSPDAGVGGGFISGGGGVVGGAIVGGVVGLSGVGVASGGRGGGSGDLSTGKKKRGRPRKFDADGNLNPAYLRSKTAAAAAAAGRIPQAGFTLSTPPSFEYSAGSKGRQDKHSGSSSWIVASLGELFANTAGADFTPHVVTAHPGEDVAGKILTFAQKGHRGICVLSANGSVSNVTLRQPGASGGLLTYEGRFEILTLTGSYTISDNDGMRSRSGGLSVSLASPDGRVIGGGVAGLLMAASPIQIVVGSFVPNGFKIQKRKYRTEPKTSPTVQSALATVTAARPISQAPPETNICPIQPSRFMVQNQGESDNHILSNKDRPNSATADTADWNGSGPGSNQRPSPDINISLPFEEH
ncbi:hypothetical protein OROHE_023697 [Orobanche hederae]